MWKFWPAGAGKVRRSPRMFVSNFMSHAGSMQPQNSLKCFFQKLKLLKQTKTDWAASGTTLLVVVPAHVCIFALFIYTDLKYTKHEI